MLLFLTWSFCSLAFFIDELVLQIILGFVGLGALVLAAKVYRLSRQTENIVRADLDALLPQMSEQPSRKGLKQASFRLTTQAQIAVFLIFVSFSFFMFFMLHAAQIFGPNAGFIFVLVPIGMVALRDATSFQIVNGALVRRPWFFWFFRRKVQIEELRAFRLTRRALRYATLIDEHIEWLEFYDVNLALRFRVCSGKMHVGSLKVWADRQLASLDVLNDLRNPEVLKRLKANRL